MPNLIKDIVNLWSDINPVMGYSGGHTKELTSLFVQTAQNVEATRFRIDTLYRRTIEIQEPMLQTTAQAVLTALRTQLELSRPSGAGPSGTGMGGLRAAADGLMYIVLKHDQDKDFVRDYLEEVLETVVFEAARWWGQDFTILVRKECLDTADYMQRALDALVDTQPDLRVGALAIEKACDAYRNLFHIDGLESDDFATYWPILCEWDEVAGPAAARGYPACLEDYYQLDSTANEIETTAKAWLELDLPVTIQISERLAALGIAKMGPLQTVWDQVSRAYEIEATPDEIRRIERVCNDFGRHHIIHHEPEDGIDFSASPERLTGMISTPDDDDTDTPAISHSQLYLDPPERTSLLGLINTLVHEASQGFNLALSAKEAGSPLLNLSTALEIPMTEGMAFYREYQYWAAAQNLLGRTDLDDVQTAYLELYGDTPNAQLRGVLCAQLETWIWRVIRYTRALCDVWVNGGEMTYTDFIMWAANLTGLSEETLHGECFPYMAAPGYAPCSPIGGASYAAMQKQGIPLGVSEIDFNTYASRQGFYPWPVARELLQAYAS